MNIYQHLLISVCLLLVINIDESIVDSKNIILQILQKHMKQVDKDNSEVVIDESREKYGGGVYIFNASTLDYHEDSEEGSSSEEMEDVECRHALADISQERGNKISNEEIKNKNSNEESGSKSTNEKSWSKSSSGENGSKNSNEESGSKSSNEESGSKNSNEESRNQNSYETSKIKNSNKKNKIKKCKEKKCNEKKCNEKNKTKISNKENVIKNVHEENKSENSIEEVGIKPSNNWSYLSSIDTFHKAKPQEYPYHVAFIWNPDGRVLCQGALIKTGWVVTSASCISRYEFHIKSISVLVGATSLDDETSVSYELSKIFYHPAFIPEYGLNDFALVMLEDEILTNPEKQLKTLPVNHLPLKKRCQFTTFVGNTLYGKSVNYIFQEQCDKINEDNQVLPYMCASVDGKLIKLTQISTLGSPLVCNGIVYGIKAKNSFFTSVDSLADWIDRTITELNPANEEFQIVY